jgi:hypothetical protein
VLSKEAYHLASLLFEGVFTLHEFRAVLHAYGVPEEAIPNYLRSGIAELCSQKLVTWEFIPDYGGDLPQFFGPRVMRGSVGFDLAPKLDPLGMLETKGFHGGLAPREKFANSTGVRSPRAL